MYFAVKVLDYFSIDQPMHMKQAKISVLLQTKSDKTLAANEMTEKNSYFHSLFFGRHCEPILTPV